MGANDTRVLLLGATGFLGGHLARDLASRFTVSAPGRRAFDARHVSSLDAVLEAERPDVVVNAVAITPASPLYGDAEAMVEVNSLFPQRLASRARARGWRLIHVSSDAVFSGRRGGYLESDLPDPADLYGRSKLAGEVEGPGCLNVRTSFFGRNPGGVGLIEWLLRQDGRRIDGYTDYVFSGVSAPVLAGVISELVARPLEGVLHVGGSALSKYDLLRAAARAFGLPLDIRPAERGRVDRSLDTSRLAAYLPRPLPDLDQMMDALAHGGRRAASNAIG